MAMPPQPNHRADIPPDLAEGLPPDILNILEANSSVLVQNGIVECRTERRRRPTYRLRFRERASDGSVRHRSASLGNDQAVAEQVGRILTYWRSLRREALRRRREAEQERRRQRVESRRLQALVAMSTGGGRRHRRRIRQQVNDLVSFNDPVAGLRLLAQVENGSASPTPRGRPRKGRQLW